MHSFLILPMQRVTRLPLLLDVSICLLSDRRTAPCHTQAIKKRSDVLVLLVTSGKERLHKCLLPSPTETPPRSHDLIHWSSASDPVLCSSFLCPCLRLLRCFPQLLRSPCGFSPACTFHCHAHACTPALAPAGPLKAFLLHQILRKIPFSPGCLPTSWLPQQTHRAKGDFSWHQMLPARVCACIACLRGDLTRDGCSASPTDHLSEDRPGLCLLQRV